MIRRFAGAFGIDPMRARIERERELKRDPSSEEEIQAVQDEIKRMREGEKDPQMIVKEAKLENYIREGWQLVSVLPSQRILIRK